MAFVPDIEPLIVDEAITEIMVVPSESGHSVFVEKDGQMSRVDGLSISPRQLEAFGVDIARNHLGRELDRGNPALSATLENGSRVAIMIPPASDGIAVTIRNFRRHVFTIEDLITTGSISPELAEYIRGAIEKKRNVLISGANGSGKTSILNALASAFIPPNRRVIVLEDDVREIMLPNHANKLHFRAGAHISMSRLLQEALRHRIQHIIIGEVTGPEGLDLLNALNTGHSGTFATLHADSAVLALNRLTSCVMSASKELSYQSIRLKIADSVHHVLQMEMINGRRRVSDFVNVQSYSPETDTYRFERPIPV